MAGGGIDSPTLELSNATLASSGAQNLQKKIFTEFEGSNRLADSGDPSELTVMQNRKGLYTACNGQSPRRWCHLLAVLAS